MKRILKRLAWTILSIIIGLFIFGLWYVGEYPVLHSPRICIDPVMVDGELYFILPEGDKYGTKEIKVFPVPMLSEYKPLWGMNYKGNFAPLTETDEEEKIYPKLKQIKYGRKIKGFKKYFKPQKLNKNTKYSVFVYLTHGKIMDEDFFIINDNRILVPSAYMNKHPKNHIYSVIIEKNGKKISVPYSVSVDKSYYKRVISYPQKGKVIK